MSESWFNEASKKFEAFLNNATKEELEELLDVVRKEVSDE